MRYHFPQCAGSRDLGKEDTRIGLGLPARYCSSGFTQACLRWVKLGSKVADCTWVAEARFRRSLRLVSWDYGRR